VISEFFLLTIVFGVALYFIKNKTVSHSVLFLYVAVFVAFNIYEYQHINEREDDYFQTDSLGLIFLFTLSVLVITSSIDYINYAKARKEPIHSISVHNIGFILFISAIVGVSLTDHFGMLWAFFEATTLGAAILIYHDRDNLALEATWKFIFVLSIAVAFALAGILFLGLAAENSETLDFSIASVTRQAPTMNPIWLKASFLFILAGFSAKMSLVPFFNVDIDAKDVAPSPVSALFSSAFMNVGFIAIFRFYKAFADSSILSWMNNVLMITGAVSIIIATIYLLNVKNYKRMLAYSSMEHAGIVIIALALGEIGQFAAILHLILHSFTKASLFYQIGQVYRLYGSKMISETGGYFYHHPVGALVILFGFFCVTAMPPSGLFVSEWMIFKAMFNHGLWWLAVLLLASISLIIYALATNFFQLLFIKPQNMRANVFQHISPWQSVSQYILLAAVIYVGFYQSDYLVYLIKQAVGIMPKTIGMQQNF
jgi:hydrogenase-4 component F